METKKVSLRSRSVSTGGLLRPHLFVLLFLLSACASVTEAPPADGFHIRWDMLLPVHDYIFLGDDPPECTDAEANSLAYRRDHTLLICTGGEHGNGWKPVLIGGTVTCDVGAR